MDQLHTLTVHADGRIALANGVMGSGSPFRAQASPVACDLARRKAAIHIRAGRPR